MSSGHKIMRMRVFPLYATPADLSGMRHPSSSRDVIQSLVMQIAEFVIYTFLSYLADSNDLLEQCLPRPSPPSLALQLNTLVYLHKGRDCAL